MSPTRPRAGLILAAVAVLGAGLLAAANVAATAASTTTTVAYWVQARPVDAAIDPLVKPTSISGVMPIVVAADTSPNGAVSAMILLGVIQTALLALALWRRAAAAIAVLVATLALGRILAEAVRFDVARTILFALGLFAVAEFAYWSTELRVTVDSDGAATRTRLLWMGGVAAVAVSLSLFTAYPLPLPRTPAVTVLAATTVLGLLVVIATMVRSATTARDE
jgi:hypothetical protein